jgi:acetylornithine/N-succinyldiaminopimelate aminotransferase
MAREHLMKTYAPQPVAFSHGKGVWLWDVNGKQYLDGLAGIAVSGLGHAHPVLSKALADQAGKLIHTSNLFEVREQEVLAEKLCKAAGMDNVFFSNSGAEANECAIKLARMYGVNKGIEAPTIIVMDKSWHGRTLATLAATGSEKARKGFGPLPSGFTRVPYNDLAAVEAAIKADKSVSAVLLEVLQGEGGIREAWVDYVQGLRKLCDQHDLLLMIDEVQSGVGRTGKWFCYQWANVLPDVLPLAKGIASGFPLGATLARGKAAQVFKPGNHGTTFGGGPLACVAGIVTFDVMEKDGLLANAAAMGELIASELKKAFADTPQVLEIRGRGLMLGVAMDRPCGEVTNIARENGLIVNVTNDTVVRVLPPMVINREESLELVKRLAQSVKQFLAQTNKSAAA